MSQQRWPSVSLTRLALVVGVPLATLVGARLDALAAVSLKTWNSGDTLTAADLNANFEALRVSTANSKSYSLNGLYCGTTVTTHDGALTGQPTNGYARVKLLCEGKCGTATAHACMPEELLRSTSIGLTIVDGWYNTGLYTDYYAGPGGRSDCDGWTTTSTTRVGALWSNGRPSAGICNMSYSFACCD